jgi:NDP-sugar pyrophosphorylase family protein
MAQAGSIRRAIVLAHGRGDDCFPYGGDKALRPKYAMEVNCVPLVRRVVDAVRQVGVREIAVVAGFRAEAVEAVFADEPANVKPRFVRVEPYDQGDAVALAAAIKQMGTTGNLLVVNADLSAQVCEYRAVAKAFADTGGQSVCALADELPREEDKLSWHTVEIDNASKKITAFNGPVGDGVYRLCGLYAIPAADVGGLSKLPQTGSGERIYLARHLGSLVGHERPIVAVLAGTPVVHVDRCFDYLEANQQQVNLEVASIPQRTGKYVYRAGEGKPDPRYIFPGTIIHRGSTLVFEEEAFISPYDSLEDHLAAIKDPPHQATPIRIRGNLYMGARAHIALGSLIEGGLFMWPQSSVDDSLIEANVILGPRAVIRRSGVVRGKSVIGSDARVECGADVEGVAGPGTIYMHPGQCWIVTGKECDLGAGNFFGTWRFDSKASKYVIRGRQVTPKESVSNATYFGDKVRSAVMVNFTPGTRVGSDTLIGPGIVATGTLEGGRGYLLKQDIVKMRVGLLRRS